MVDIWNGKSCENFVELPLPDRDLTEHDEVTPFPIRRSPRSKKRAEKIDSENHGQTAISQPPLGKKASRIVPSDLTGLSGVCETSSLANRLLTRSQTKAEKTQPVPSDLTGLSGVCETSSLVNRPLTRSQTKAEKTQPEGMVEFPDTQQNTTGNKIIHLYVPSSELNFSCFEPNVNLRKPYTEDYKIRRKRKLMEFLNVQYAYGDFPRYDYHKELFEECVGDETPCDLRKFPFIIYGGDVCPDNVKLVADQNGTHIGNESNTDGDVYIWFLHKNETSDGVYRELCRHFEPRFCIIIEDNAKRQSIQNSIRKLVMSCLEYKFIEYIEAIENKSEICEATLNQLIDHSCFRQSMQTTKLEEVEKIIGSEYMDSILHCGVSGEGINITVTDEEVQHQLCRKFKTKMANVNIQTSKEKKKIEKCKMEIQGTRLHSSFSSGGTLGGLAHCNGLMYGITCFHCCKSLGNVKLSLGGEDVNIGDDFYIGPPDDKHVKRAIQDIAIVKFNTPAKQKINEMCTKALMCPNGRSVAAKIYLGENEDLVKKRIFLKGATSKFIHGMVNQFSIEDYADYPIKCKVLTVKSLSKTVQPGDSGSLVCRQIASDKDATKIDITVVGVLIGKELEKISHEPLKLSETGIFTVIPLMMSLEELKSKYSHLPDLKFYDPE